MVGSMLCWAGCGSLCVRQRDDRPAMRSYHLQGGSCQWLTNCPDNLRSRCGLPPCTHGEPTAAERGKAEYSAIDTSSQVIALRFWADVTLLKNEYRCIRDKIQIFERGAIHQNQMKSCLQSIMRRK